MDTILGIMAGSSLDGLDICLVEFKEPDREFGIKKATTVPYDLELLKKLKGAAAETEKEQAQLSVFFAKWVGKVVLENFDQDEIDLVAFHGHTTVHSPRDHISRQLGDGQTLADILGVCVITNFRNKDISLGGQGAPLVPVGDFQIFEQFDACLNLGGIANISLAKSQQAWDICPCNQVLNHYASKLGYPYDPEGTLALSGKLDEPFLAKILAIPFFNEQPPKSLPNDFLKAEVLDQVEPENGLHTYAELIARIVGETLKRTVKNILVTGGGANNTYLMSRIVHYCPEVEVVVPSPDLVNFKEAIVFAFLGKLRMEGKINVLKSVTGAREDSCSGEVHYPSTDMIRFANPRK